jgi:tetratricopeptide (TPR) repeat protein
MQRWLCFCLLLGLSGVSAAQQKPQQSPPPAAPSSQSSGTQSPPDPVDGLSRDKTFPGDRPGNAAPTNAEPANSEPGAKRAPSAPSMEPPRSDRVRADDLDGVGESSSRDTQVDLSPPEDDAKAHPKSSAAVADAEAEVSGGVSEFHTWDPHKAAKSIEVGDYYFKRKNYRAAEDRYREALRYKDNDAVATIRLAVCLEKLGILDDARAEYESYLKILPHGPQAMEAQKAIERLKEPTAAAKQPQ